MDVREYNPDHVKHDEPDYEEMRQEFAKEPPHQSDEECAASEGATPCTHKHLIIMLDLGPLWVVTASEDLLHTTERQHITLAITPVGADSLWSTREAITSSCKDLIRKWIHLQDTPLERPRELLTLRQCRVLEEADQRCHDTLAVANINEIRLRELMKANLIELATPMLLNGEKTVGIDAVYSMFGRDNSRKNKAGDMEATCMENHMNTAAAAEVTSLCGQLMYSVRLQAHVLQKDSALYSLCWYLKDHLLHHYHMYYNEPRREVVVIPPERWHVSYKGTVQGEDDIVELAGVRKTQNRLEQHQESRHPGTWREPRQPEYPPPNVTSSSSGGNPVKLEPTTGEAAEVGLGESETESVDRFTVLDSDESDASIFGLRSVLHEVEEIDELSDASSQESESANGGRPMAMAERERVSKWRQNNFLLDDLDFAYVYTDFEEAYSHAGRAVAVAWSRARVLAEPGMVSDMAKMSTVEATATKIRRVDEQRKAAATKKKKMADTSFLRQPGKGAEPEEKDEDKARFIEPMAQLMMDCRVGRAENASATDEEIMNSLRRKATRVVGTAEIPTLHRARTTADEVRIYLRGRATHMGVDNMEPIALEEFLRQSRARVRAVNAIGWMCNNLQLGWPIEKVERPDTKQVSLIGAECKQALAAQPGMLKALTERMVTAAETDDPTWLALLASWLQAMANLSLGHVLRRSVPVELYGGWMLFFCKRGKQKHNRAGFYWGAPSETSGGYDWTVKFLKEYDIRRRSDVGKDMMGMIFRTDTFEYLSAKEVKALTMNVVIGGIKNPWALMATTYSWRRLLPTAALHLNFSPAERRAIGDWKGVNASGDEAPITLRYAEGKKGKSRTCRLICAAVFSSLASEGIDTFDEIPAQQWEILTKEARAKVESVTLEVNAVWRNPDVAESGKEGFKVKRSQVAFPKQLAGVPLSPSSRDGKRYCADFQAGKCQEADACPLGLHKCAAVFRGGRTCHGNHPGSECRNTKRHAALEKANPESPAQKEWKVEVPEDQPKAGRAGAGLQPTPKQAPWKRGDKVDTPEYVVDDSIMRRLLPKLRAERDNRRGNRLNPEPPRLVAKVCREEGRGELWLGPIPTAQRMNKISETKHSIQVFCFAKAPFNVQVEEPDGEWGMDIPGTKPFRCEMSNSQARLADMRALRSCLVNSLRQGDNAYVHCVSGISRAPMAAAVMCAMLMGISFEEAKNIIHQTRNVSFNKGERRMQGAWIDEVLSERVINVAAPTGFSCRVSNPDGVVVHATTLVGGAMEPICHREEGADGKQNFKRNSVTVESIEEAFNEFGGRFCVDCEVLLKASLRLQVDRFFGQS